MRPSQAKAALKVFIDIKRPAMLHGSPGVGKSDVVRSLAKELDLELIDVRLSQLDSVDLRGVPSVNLKEHRTEWNPPEFLPRDGRGILFLDEINSAPTSVQAAAYQLLLDRKLGEYTLPDGWTILAAGNRASDKAIVNQMSTALKNRLAHLNYEVHNDDWCEWAIKADIHEAIIGFIRFRPHLLNEFEKRNDSKEERDRVSKIKDTQAFATPRTWEFCSQALSHGLPSDSEYEIIAGIVGEAAAGEFIGFMKYYRSLPNIDLILANPGKAEVPENPAVLYALSTAIAARADKDNMERVVEYALRIPVEFQTLLVKDAALRDSSVTYTKAFTKWAIANGQYMTN
jgi:hypothetical protein